MKRKLITGVRNNDTFLVEELLKQGVTPNCRDHATPLQLAVRRGNVAMVQMLLNHGANPNARSLMGRTVLEFVMTSKHDEALMLQLVRLLLAHGADASRAAYFRTHDELAKRIGSVALCKLLGTEVCRLQIKVA